MNGMYKLGNLVCFVTLISLAMFFYSKDYPLASLLTAILAATQISLVLKRLDAEKAKLKTQIITFSNSYNITPDFFLFDVNLKNVIAVDTDKNKVVVYENSDLSIYDLSFFSGADVECGKMNRVIFYRNSAALPTLSLNIRKGQCDAYHSYIQTIFGH